MAGRGDRRPRVRQGGGLQLHAALAFVAGCALVSAPAVGRSADQDPHRADPSMGIWKAVVPPGAMHGEFANNDPLGLAAGVAIPADCSINWVDPDAGKLYCFSSATSLVVFLDSPHAYLERARAQWRHLEDRR
jgi:hypothetical protein